MTFNEARKQGFWCGVCLCVVLALSTWGVVSWVKHSGDARRVREEEEFFDQEWKRVVDQRLWYLEEAVADSFVIRWSPNWIRFKAEGWKRAVK
jgi:hypothetical protein